MRREESDRADRVELFAELAAGFQAKVEFPSEATAGIADELSKQYDLSYVSTGTRDGVWHTIRVEVTNPAYRVRARRGYLAN